MQHTHLSPHKQQQKDMKNNLSNVFFDFNYSIFSSSFIQLNFLLYNKFSSFLYSFSSSSSSSSSSYSFFPSPKRYIIINSLHFTFKDFFQRYLTSSSSLSSTSLSPSSSTSSEKNLLSLYQNMVSGGLAGGISLLFIYPMDYPKILLAQEQFGFFSLYKGFSLSLLGVVTYRSIYFGLYDTFSIRNISLINLWKKKEEEKELNSIEITRRKTVLSNYLVNLFYNYLFYQQWINGRLYCSSY